MSHALEGHPAISPCIEKEASGSDPSSAVRAAAAECAKESGHYRRLKFTVRQQVMGFSGQLRRLFLLSDPHLLFWEPFLDFRVSGLSC
jgi:hypothetical protein